MKIIPVCGVSILVLLASCGSSPGGTSQNNGSVAATSLDATVDLTVGINSSYFQDWVPTSDPFYLVKSGGTGAGALLAQSHLDAAGRTTFSLPTATAIAPYLDTVSWTPAQYGNGCTVTEFSVTPTSYKALVTDFVLKPATGSIAYLSVVAWTADGSTRRTLQYVDRDVTFKTRIHCIDSGRVDDFISNGVWLKGWNVSTETTVMAGTNSAPQDTHTLTVTNSANGVAGLALIGGTEAIAPAP